MKKLVFGLLLVLFSFGSVAYGTANEESDGEDVLLVRYACLVGGREVGSAPMVAGVLGPGELSDLLLEWEPKSDNREVREVFALNDLGELARQAAQLPLSGGAVSGVYARGESSFGLSLNVGPIDTLDSGEEAITLVAEIQHDGEILTRSTVLTRVGERAIITTTNGPDAPFLFLVIEVDRISSDELVRRGLRHAWRKDYLLVDGEDVMAPIAIEKIQPGYPEEARKQKHQGRVVLRMVINADGEVEGVEVIEGQPYGLSEAAVAAARSWRFSPAMRHDEPVAVFYVVTINFRLE